jgi:putative glutamine amidotransferase
MVTRPVIGVAWPKADYSASLERAGAEIRQLRPEADTLPEALDRCDGVLLTGGVDIDPVEYGDHARHGTLELDPVRDQYELAIARTALDRDLPLFAICRGAQVLNVAAGGTLVQDIPSQQPTDVTHSLTQPKNAIVHDIAIAPSSCLGVLLAPRLHAGGRIGVNSRHHQSVRAVAPGFVVSATAPDGVIEAIEKPEARFCLGVQWHPENFWRDGRFSGLFVGLLDAARRYRAARVDSANADHRGDQVGDSSTSHT